MSLTIRAARPTDIGPLCYDARDMDHLEAEMVGTTLKRGLRHGISHGDAWTILLGDKRVMMFGVIGTSLIERRGRVWAVATKTAEANWRQLLPVGEDILCKLTERYMTLENYVHADNAKAIRWLRWSGFEVGEPEEIRGTMVRKLSLCAIPSP